LFHRPRSHDSENPILTLYSSNHFLEDGFTPVIVVVRGCCRRPYNDTDMSWRVFNGCGADVRVEPIEINFLLITGIELSRGPENRSKRLRKEQVM